MKDIQAFSSFLGNLFLVLMTLKLCGVIDPAWWMVAAPLWAPLAAMLLVLIAGLVMSAKPYKGAK